MAADPRSRGHRLGDLSPWGPPGTAAFRGGAGCVPALGGWLSEKEEVVGILFQIHTKCPKGTGFRGASDSYGISQVVIAVTSNFYFLLKTTPFHEQDKDDVMLC